MTWQAWKNQFNFPWWNLIAWILWAATFAVLEFMGVRWPNQYATLTYLSKHAVPRAILAMVMGWLTWHFLVQSTR